MCSSVPTGKVQPVLIESDGIWNLQLQSSRRRSQVGDRSSEATTTSPRKWVYTNRSWLVGCIVL